MKVGLCGLGDRLIYVANTMSRLLPDFDVVACAEPNKQRVEEVFGTGKKVAYYSELEALLRAESLDLLMIGSPNFMHFDQMKAAMDTGVRVFIEKPVVMTEEQTFDLLDILSRYGELDRVLVGLVLRYAPMYGDLKRATDDGTLGEIMSIEATEHIAPEHGAFFMRDWRRKSAWSGGFFLEKCCHDMDVYRSIIGARPNRVVSFGGRKTFTSANSDRESNSLYHQRTSRWRGSKKVFDDDTDLIDYQTALIEYENSANLCFHTNLNVPDESRHFTVVGSNGMAEGDFVRNFLRIHDSTSGKMLCDTSYDYDDGVSLHYGAEMRMAKAWQNHFSEGAELPVSILDALEAGLTAIKLDESRQTGKIIDMTELWQRFDSYGLR